jgi:hypothetical protein
LPTRAGAVVRFRAVIEAQCAEIVRLRNAGLIFHRAHAAGRA